jgi:hypothetical protein
MIYISLTTVPIRINLWESFEQNLLSLLNQNTDKDYKVVLSIPYCYKNNNDEEYVINDNLKLFAQQNPKLIINRVDKDYGPIVKITGVLNVSNNPEDILIICDDDHVYHEDMLEYHLKKLTQYPNSAIAFRGDTPVEKREWEEDNIKKYVLRTTHFYFPVKNDLQLNVPGHWHSVSYKRKYFKEDFNEDFLTSSDNDDTLMGYYCKKHQIDIRCVAWDKETDWRPVNEHNRPAYSFPIKYSLPYPNSGFWEFRQKSGDSYGRSKDYIYQLLQNHDIIYIEKQYE